MFGDHNISLNVDGRKILFNEILVFIAMPHTYIPRERTEMIIFYSDN